MSDRPWVVVLNPVHLQTLQTVLRCGSFADAARRLGYTPSAVSQQISTLERQLKVTLFERDAHSIRATPAADFLVESSAAALGSLRALEEDVQLLLGGVVGRLRVGSFPTASERLLPAALSAFRSSHARIDVRLDEGEPQDLVPMLLARELDVALVYRYPWVPRPWPRGIITQPLVTEDLLLLLPCGHPQAGREHADLMGLVEETWVSTRDGTSAAAMLLQLCRSRGFEPDVSYRSNNYRVVRGLVRAGMGIAVVPALGYEPEEGIAASRLASDRCVRDVFLASSPATPRALVEGITEALLASSELLAETALGVAAPRL